MWPGNPMLDSQPHRQPDSQEGEQRIHTAPQKEGGQQSIRERHQDARQHRDCRQPSNAFGERVDYLAAVLEADERRACPSERERVLTNQLTMLEHVLTMT